MTSTCRRRPARCASTACRPSPTAPTAPCSSNGARRSTARRSSTRRCSATAAKTPAASRRRKRSAPNCSASQPLRGTRVRSRVALVVDWDSWWGSSAHRVAAVAAPGLARAGARLERGAPRPRPPRRHGARRPARSTATTSSSCRTSTSRMPRRRPRSPTSSPRGGQLVVGPFSGVVDATEKVHDGGAPGPLRDLLGVEVDEHWPIPDGRTGTASNVAGDRVRRITRSGASGSSCTTAPRCSRRIRTRRARRARRCDPTRQRRSAGAAWYLGARARARRA